MSAFAARAALRAIPFFGANGDTNNFKGPLEEIILPSFWALAAILSILKWDRETVKLNTIATSVYEATDEAANLAAGGETDHAVYYLAAAAFFTTATFAANSNDTASDHAFNAAISITKNYSELNSSTMVGITDVYLKEYLWDKNFINKGNTAQDLTIQRLWENTPDDGSNVAFNSIISKWNDLKLHLLSLDHEWKIWTDWYEDRLRGNETQPFTLPFNEEIEIGLDPKKGQYGRVTFPPEDYKNPAKVNAQIKQLIADYRQRQKENEPASGDEELGEFNQVPGAFNFSLVEGALEARQLTHAPHDRKMAEGALEELRAIAAASKLGLDKNMADPLLIGSIDRLVKTLSHALDILPTGTLQMQIDALDGFTTAFADPSNDQEKNILGSLLGLQKALLSFQAMYPELQEVLANKLTMELQTQDVDAVNANINDIIIHTEKSLYIGQSTIGALNSGQNEFNDFTEKLIFTLPEKKAPLEVARAKVTAHRLVTLRNFLTKVSDETKDVSKDSYKALKKGSIKGIEKGAEETVSAAVKVGLAALLATFSKPLAGIALATSIFEGFRKKSDKAKDIVEDDTNSLEI